MTDQPAFLLSLTAAAEKRLVRPGGSTRHAHFAVRVAAPLVPSERRPLSLALMIDRSGSIHGDKLATTRRAAQAVVKALDERDLVSITVFDHEVQVILPAGPAAPEQNTLARAQLQALEHLHEIRRATEEHRVSVHYRKESGYQSHRLSRSQRDLRGGLHGMS
jgi:hypothetical protein